MAQYKTEEGPNKATADRLFEFMVDRARFGDRIYFCSDATAAKELGLSRRTIIRARQRLEASGRIVRQGVRKVGRCRSTVVYGFPPNRRRKPRVTQRSSNRRARPYEGCSLRSDSSYEESSLRSHPSAQAPRRRRMMGDVVPITPGGDSERRVPSLAPGQQLFAAIVDELDALGVVIPRASIAVAVRHGKAALEDGVDPEAVLVGCLTALRQGKGRFATDYIAEVAVVKAGRHLSRREYEQMLEAHKAITSPAKEAERSLLARVLGKEKGEQ